MGGPGPANRGQFAALLAPGRYRVMVDAGKARPLEYPRWVNLPDMPWNPITDQRMSTFPIMPAMPEGTDYPVFNPQLGGTKSYEAAPFGMAFVVTWPMWRDERYGLMDSMAAEQGRSARQRKEVLAAAVLNNGFDTAKVGYSDDATSLVSTSHVSVDGSRTFANRPAVDIGFSMTYLQGAIERFEGLTNDMGLSDLMAPKMALIGPQNRWAAREILGSSSVPYKTDNEVNAIIEDDISWMVLHFLTNATAHFLVAAKGEHDLNFFILEDEMFDAFDTPQNRNAVFSNYMRMSEASYGTWRGVDGSRASA